MTRIADGGEPTPCDTIDNIVDRLRLERVNLIKMDIEGAERGALAGARETIQTQRPRLAISGYHLPDDIYLLPALIKEIVPDYTVIVTKRMMIFAVPPNGGRYSV
jgi:hypothetical protein